MDPLTKDYPWYTPYQFAGNMPIEAIDLDGAEPLFSNGEFTGQYRVMPGQGPTQIMENLSSYGINVHWSSIVFNNRERFFGHIPSPSWVKDNPKFRKLNMNPGDIVHIPTLDQKVQLSTSLPSDFNIAIGAVDLSAGFGLGGSGQLMTFNVPDNHMSWESGKSMYSSSLALTVTTPGAELGLGAGNISVKNMRNYSLTKHLNNSNSVSVSGGGTFIVGGRYTHAFGYSNSNTPTYDINLGQMTFGIGGFGGSVSSGNYSVGGFGLVNYMTRKDSIITAFKFRDNEYFFNYLNSTLNNQDSTEMDLDQENKVNNDL